MKLNQKNPSVKDYICDVIRFWVKEFDIDGLRLDAADVLDFDFMKELRRTADAVKPDFWLMGEVIHGDYSRWANANTLHSVTNYSLHKGLHSGMNDHNFFEIAHTIRYTKGMIPAHIKLYNFVDNHDVERISTKLINRAHYTPVHIMLYTLPGIPSVYYGSEFGIEGKKERFSDDSLRPYIDIKEHSEDYEKNPCTKLIASLGKIHKKFCSDLTGEDYRELCLTNRQFAYGRGRLIIALNNDDNATEINVPAVDGEYRGLLFGDKITAVNGRLQIKIQPNSGEIFAPVDIADNNTGYISDIEEEKKKPAKETKAKAEEQSAVESGNRKLKKIQNDKTTEAKEPENIKIKEKKSTEINERKTVQIPDIPYEEMTVEQLQAVIISKMEKNGPVTDRMRKDVQENIWKNSLVNWAKSFR